VKPLIKVKKGEDHIDEDGHTPSAHVEHDDKDGHGHAKPATSIEKKAKGVVHDDSDGHGHSKPTVVYTGFNPTSELLKRVFVVVIGHVGLIVLALIGFCISKKFGPIKCLGEPSKPKIPKKKEIKKTPESKKKPDEQKPKPEPEVKLPVINEQPALIEGQPGAV